MNYRVISSNNIGELENEVNGFISCGWKAQGGIAVSEFMYLTSGSQKFIQYYCQAMTKEKTNETETN